MPDQYPDHPPRISGFSRWLLKHMLSPLDFWELTADLDEVYAQMLVTGTKGRAMIWVWLRILESLPGLALENIKWRTIMLRNFVKIAFRNILRYKIFSLINIAGLAAGMTVAALIFLLIRYETTYDNFHPNADSIFRVADGEYGTTSANLAEALKQEFPEVQYSARLVGVRGIFRYRDKFFTRDTKFFCADSDFFRMFSYPSITGDTLQPMEEPFSLLITQEMAEKYFGDQDPVGQTIAFQKHFDFVVKGVLKNIPENTHFKFDCLASMETYRAMLGERREYFLNRWGSHDYWTYVKLHDGITPKQLVDKFGTLEEKYREQEELDLFLQPVKKIHLSGNLRFEIEANTDVRYLMFLSVLAFLILLIACFNFINLSTAQSARRAKEVGLRKVIGSNRGQLIRQFFLESIIYTLISFGITMALMKLALPAFNAWAQRTIRFDIFGDFQVFLILAGVALFSGIVSGFYPAVFLSSFQPVRIIKGISASGSKGGLRFRNGLVAAQFAITIFLITGSLVVFNQLNYLKEKSFGFLGDQVVNITLSDARLRANPEIFEDALSKSPGVVDMTSSYNLPIFIPTGNSISWDGMNKEESFIIRQTNVQPNFVRFYGIKILAGRDFFQENWESEGNSILINQTAARRIGWENPIGKRLQYGDTEGVVVGLMEDFHFKSLYDLIEPLAVSVLADEGFFAGANYCSVKIRPENVSETLKFMEASWNNLSPDTPFYYSFLDDSISKRYQNEQRIGRGISVLTSVAIFLACLGIFGLSLFAAQEKTKEIGIRRVLGAPALTIVFMLSKKFLRSVLLGALVAFPVGWYVMNQWLQNFAYHSDIRLGTFIIAGGTALTVALIAAGFQSVKAAIADPVKSLRYE